MKIILAQISISQNYKYNLEKIINIINNNKFNIIIFPELSLTSYNLKKAIKLSNKKIFKSLKSIQKKLNKEQVAIIGTIIKNGNKLYNSAAIINKKKIIFYNKSTLTEYDSKYLNKGKDILCFQYKKHRIGLLICRDQNNVKLIKRYRKVKCDILIQLSAHYYDKNTASKKLDKNIAMPIVRAIDSNTLLFKVNTVGESMDKVSLGSSMIVSSDGYILKKAKQFKEEIIKFRLNSLKCKKK